MLERASKTRGFSLLEVMLVVSLVSILTAVFVPGLGPVGKKTALRATADAVADRIGAARELAMASGRCVVLSMHATGNTRLLKAQRVTGYNCEGTITVGAGGVTMTGATLVDAKVGGAPLDLEFSNTEGVTFKDAGLSATSEALVFRPNGWSRGDNFGASAETQVTDDGWSIKLVGRGLPANGNSLTIAVSPVGLVCVKEEGGHACP
jgi:prepilin-type N-terminal cleavage/methylation domain-containing protein